MLIFCIYCSMDRMIGAYRDFIFSTHTRFQHWMNDALIFLQCLLSLSDPNISLSLHFMSGYLTIYCFMSLMLLHSMNSFISLGLDW